MDKKNSLLKSAIKGDTDLFDYLTSKGSHHNHYKHYSNVSSISRIIEQRCLYLTRGDNWNDLDDRHSFHKMSEDRLRFGACLSFSVSENIAMWMLYGGTSKSGAMIDLTKGDASSILSLTEFKAGYLDEKGKFADVTLLTKNEGCDLYFVDVLYCGKDDDGLFSARRSDECAYELEALPSRHNVTTKSLPWSYENEVRLVLEAPASLVPDNVELIRIPLSKTSEELKARAYLAPNNETKGSGFNRSKLKGSLDWDICKRCSLKL